MCVIGQPQSFFAWLNGVLPKTVNLGLKKTNGACRTVFEKAALKIKLNYKYNTAGNTVSANTNTIHSMFQRSKWPVKCKVSTAIAKA